ncbi:hypothetical protein ACTTAL_11025 [Rhodobacter capsulatus]
MCTADHALVFYNGQAVDLLGGAQAPGLDRRVFDYLHPAPIRHAHARLLATADPDAASDLLCATVADGRTLAARMRLISEGEDHQVRRLAGYVLTLRDVSADLRAHAGREALMDELFDRIRRPAAALQSLMGVLIAEDGPADPQARAQLREAARAEAGHLAQAIHSLHDRHEAMRADWWPLAMIRASDFGAAVQARVAAEGAGDLLPVTAALLLRLEGFEMVALIAHLVRRLGPGRAEKRLEVLEDGAGGADRARMARRGGGDCRSGAVALRAARCGPGRGDRAAGALCPCDRSVARAAARGAAPALPAAARGTPDRPGSPSGAPSGAAPGGL